MACRKCLKRMLAKPLHLPEVTACCTFVANGIIGPYFLKNEGGIFAAGTGERYLTMISSFLCPKLNDVDV